MANGFQHAKATRRNLIIISTVCVGATIFYGPLPLLLIPGAYLGHAITPDLDLSEAHPIYVQRKIIQRHKVLGWILYSYWYPYSKLCKHRGMSHSFPLGTIIRMIYTLWIPFLLADIYFPQWFSSDLIPAWYAILFMIFLGWSVNDLTHIFMDTKFYKNNLQKSTRTRF